MSTLQQFREGMSIAWEALVEGWRELYQQAANALTHFSPERPKGELLPRDADEFAIRSTRWGVLAAEVFDDGDRVVVRLEAPGMEADEFDLQVIDDMLVVRGQKQLQRERTQGRYHVSECAYGSFERAIQLPDDVDSEQAGARYRRGVLRVELPKAEHRRRQSIKVKVQ